MRTSKIALLFLIGLLLLAAAGVAALWLVDPAVFRDQIEVRASKAFGRPFRIQGAIGIERSLHPRIILQKITIGNPEWAAEKYFARADEVAIQVALVPLLFGEMRVLDVRFAGMDIFIENRSDGANNYTFGDADDREAPGRLPSIEQMLIRDAVIRHRSARGEIDRYEVAQAQLWNIPGEPERIQAEGLAKGMQSRIQFAADSAAELSGPENPWSVHLEMEGEHMALTFDGQMAQVFSWDQLEGRLVLRGEQTDELALLLESDIPLEGPFELAATLRSSEGTVHLTDLAAKGRGPSGRPAIAISEGTASIGPDAPLSVTLHGKLDDMPLAFRLASERLPAWTASETPWPLTVSLNLADTDLVLQGTISNAADGGKPFNFDGRLQGDSLDTLARLVDYELPQTGPYRLTFQAAFGEDGGEITGLQGFIRDTAHWQRIQIEHGHASADAQGRLAAALTAACDDIPFSLNFQGGPQTDAGLPAQIEATLPGATLKADGAVVTSGDRPEWQLATTIDGNRLDTLGKLIAVSLPDIGNYTVNTTVHSDGTVHELRNLRVQLGAQRFSGTVQWEDKTPRPLLTARLSSKNLSVNALAGTVAGPAPSGKSSASMNQPLALDWLEDLDARLDIEVEQISDSRLAVEKFSSSMTLTEGRLSVPFEARVAGTPVRGNMTISRRRSTPTIALQTSFGSLDAGQTLRQLNLPQIVDGRVEAIEFEGRSSGVNLEALLDQAEGTLKLVPDRLRYRGLIVGQEVTTTVTQAKVAAKPGQPLSLTVNGAFQTVPFEATLQAGRPADWRKKDGPLPIQVALQTADLKFKAEGTVIRPFDKMTFDLAHELTGNKIEALSPLIDIALPLRGKFHARGTLAARGDRFDYDEDLVIGKSDLQASMTLLKGAERPKISARVTSQAIHLDDIKLYETQANPTPVEAQDRYLVPDNAIPVDTLRSLDLELDLRAERLVTRMGDLGDLASQARLKDGRLTSTLTMKGFAGARLYKQLDVNAAVDPPQNRLQFDAEDIDYGFLQRQVLETDLAEGLVDVQIDLAGPGATRRLFLANADGYITVIGGPGRITGRRLDLWAADLLPTLLSPRWQRQSATELNCFVAHVDVTGGLATIEDLLLDTQRITIAGSGIVELETEAIDIFIAPRPKRASLISLANPVEITGTLAEPEVSVARLPSRRRLGRTGLLAGLINPAFLLTVFSDIGTNVSNPCEAAIDRAQEAAASDPE